MNTKFLKSNAIALALLAAPALLFSGAALAQAKDSPVGLWKTIDDETKAAKSIVRITEKDGVLSGKIEKIIDPAKADAKCTLCADDRKDKPVQGMVILTGLKKSDTEWADGQILDPNSGKIYKAKAKVIDDGKKLEMRGFIGIALLGKTQVWLREEEK
jgi:uncharacterized protein (DUF2147 family)